MRLVSCDIGNGWVKAMSSTGSVAFESVGAVEQGALKFEGVGSNHRLIVDFEGERYALGAAAYSHGRHQVATMGNSRVGKKPYRVLFAGALAQVVRQSGPLSVVLSLPVQFFNSGREEARQEMAGAYTVGYEGRTCTYQIAPEDLHIVPEGFGSLLQEVCNSDGSMRDGALARQRVGIVDVGTRTSDFIFFEKLDIAPARSDGLENTGMSTVWAMLKNDISLAHGMDLSLLDIDQALQVGYFLDSGQEVDIRHFANRALETLGVSIASHISGLWQNGRDVDTLLITGGGAYHVFPFLDFPHKRLIELGYFANCSGGYRFGLLRDFENG